MNIKSLQQYLDKVLILMYGSTSVHVPTVLHRYKCIQYTSSMYCMSLYTLDNMFISSERGWAVLTLSNDEPLQIPDNQSELRSEAMRLRFTGSLRFLGPSCWNPLGFRDDAPPLLFGWIDTSGSIVWPYPTSCQVVSQNDVNSFHWQFSQPQPPPTSPRPRSHDKSTLLVQPIPPTGVQPPVSVGKCG